jgi:hemolysin III
MSTLTHLIGVVGALIGTGWLVSLSWGETAKMVTLLIYGVSMIALYAASSLLHGVKTNDVTRMWLNRLDHVAIFLLIAGTYTPIAYNFFPNPFRWQVLAVIWLAVIIGAVYKLFGRKIHGFLNASIYVILGWGSALPLLFVSNLVTLVPLRGLLLLLIGGLIFTIGFLIYYFQRPDPWPDVFGHHEIWHLFVLGGSLCHFLFMLYFVAM